MRCLQPDTGACERHKFKLISVSYPESFFEKSVIKYTDCTVRATCGFSLDIAGQTLLLHFWLFYILKCLYNLGPKMFCSIIVGRCSK